MATPVVQRRYSKLMQLLATNEQATHEWLVDTEHFSGNLPGQRNLKFDGFMDGIAALRTAFTGFAVQRTDLLVIAGRRAIYVRTMMTMKHAGPFVNWQGATLMPESRTVDLVCDIAVQLGLDTRVAEVAFSYDRVELDNQLRTN